MNVTRFQNVRGGLSTCGLHHVNTSVLYPVWTVVSSSVLLPWVIIKALYWCPGAVITECHQLGGLKNRNALSHGFREWKSKSRCQQDCFFLWGPRGRTCSRPLSFTCGWTSSPCVSSHLLLCVFASVSKFSLFYKYTRHIGLGNPSDIILTLFYLSKDPVSQ